MIEQKTLQAIPKVLLHEHLDGGLRPATILEIGEKNKIDLPASSEEELSKWFHRGANRGSLPLYLECFGTTIAVMQSKEALERIAFEAVEDAYRENIVYLELRFCPYFHTQNGLTLEDVMEAVLSGMRQGEKKYPIRCGLIICGMRNMNISMEMAELAVDFRDRGVVGFDLAGDEKGHPPKKHIDAFHYIKRKNFNITIHAGEAFGMESIWQALQYCGAHRIGHAVRLKDDIVIQNGEVIHMGDLAQYILNNRIPLEICLSSNVQTSAIEKIEDHPFLPFYRKNFRITLNTDNRLMSDTSMTKEMEIAVKQFGVSLKDLERMTINGMKSAFIPYDERCEIIYRQIKPGYEKIKKEIKKS